MQMPKDLKGILWDVDVKSLETTKHKRFLISRITEKGSWQAVQWLKKQYTLVDIKRTVASSKNTSARTKNFWKKM
jgi:hypothetical protein